MILMIQKCSHQDVEKIHGKTIDFNYSNKKKQKKQKLTYFVMGIICFNRFVYTFAENERTNGED